MRSLPYASEYSNAKQQQCAQATGARFGCHRWKNPSAHMDDEEIEEAGATLVEEGS